MKIISFVNQKGGVGKSKLTQIVCNDLHRVGIKTVVFDMDLQHSVYNLRQAELAKLKSRGEKIDIYPILPVLPQKFLESIKPFYNEGYEYVFLDLPGSFEAPHVKEIYTWLDYAFVPTGTSPEDLMSTQGFIRLMEQQIKPGRENRKLNYCLHGLFNAVSSFVIEKHYRYNLYIELVRRIHTYHSSDKRQRTGMISFNYDTILDHYIEQNQGAFNTINDYVNWNKNQFLLFKPHGSSNWGWPIRRDRLILEDQYSFAKLIEKDSIEPYQVYYNLIGDLNEVVARNTWGHELANNKDYKGRFTINKNLIQKIPNNPSFNYMPSLLLPYRDKDEFVMPYDHYYSMKHCLRLAEDIFLIGWKGNEDLFNRLLERADHLKRIIIVNPYPDEVKENLKKYIDIDKYHIETCLSFDKFVLEELDSYLAP